MLTSAIALANDFDSGKLVGEDDSTLPQRDYRATWVLMVVSGAFCIFGRLLVYLSDLSGVMGVWLRDRMVLTVVW